MENTALPFFVGRSKETGQLAALWRRVCETERPIVVAVAGEMGVGKSRLVAEFLVDVAATGRAVSVGHCGEGGSEFYTPFTEMIAGLVRDYPTALPSGVINRVLPQIPALGKRLGVKPGELPSGTGNNRQDRLLLFGAVLSALQQIGPGVMFFDDAHRLDAASLSLLRYLVKRGAPFLVVAAMRDEGSKAGWTDEFERLHRIPLPPLGEAEMELCITNLLPPAAGIGNDLVRAVVRRSGGNPYLIETITAHLWDTGAIHRVPGGAWRYKESSKDSSLPVALTDIFSQRLGHLKSPTRRLLTEAAVIGGEFEGAVLEALLGENDEARYRVSEAVADGLRWKVLQEGESKYRFHPPELAVILAKGLTEARREKLHLKIAAVLSEQPDSDPAAIARHYEQAQREREAAAWWVKAGLRAAAVGAIDEGISCGERSLKLFESLAAYELLGGLYRQRGDAGKSIEMLQKGIGIARIRGGGTETARLLNNLALTLWLYDRYAEAETAARMALDLPGASAAQQGAAFSHLGMISWLRGRLTQAEKWCKRAVNGLEPGGNRFELAGGLNRLGLVYFSIGKFDAAEDVFRRSLTIREKLGDMWGQAFCLNNLAKVAAERGNFEEAMKLLGQAEGIFSEIESRDGLMVVLTNRGRVGVYQGDVEGALPVLSRALKFALEIDKRANYGLADIYQLIAQAHLLRGGLDRAEAALEESMRLVRAVGNQEYLAMGQLIRGRILAARGMQQDALESFRRAWAGYQVAGSRVGILKVKWCYACFLFLSGLSSGAAQELAGAAQREAAQMGLKLADESA